MINKIIYAVLIIAIGYISWTIIRGPEVIETVKTEVVSDTTTIDSLRTEISYWKEIAEEDRDTVVTEIDATTPTINSDSTITYRTSYSDSNLVADIGLTIDDDRVGEWTLRYFLRRQMVIERENEITITNEVLERRTITKTVTPRGYFSIGATVIPAQQTQLIPEVHYTTKNQRTFKIGYNLHTESIMVGASIPLRLNLNPFK